MSFQPSPPDISPPESLGREGLRRWGFPQIAGYEIDCELGRGGMATVYRATQQSLQRQVAIKVLTRELDDASEIVQRFKKEGHILARLLHPNVVTIYDVGITENNQLYLSIEYLSGGTLRERIQRGLSIDSAIYIVRCIAKALGYAHQNGVIHRDIKPSNIMFRYDDTPILTDFGVARVAESNTIHTAVGLMVGSPGYMSPEQAKGESVTLQSDLYGLGVVLYEMLTGRPPYQADNPLAVMLMHLHEPVPKLPDKCAYLQPVLNKLLAKKTADRYQNANEFLKALNLIVPSDTGSQSGWNTGSHHLSITEFASGKLQSLLKEKSQRPVWIGFIAAAILAIAVGYTLKSRNTEESIQISPEPVKPVEPILSLSREAEIAALLKQADAQLQAGLSTDEAEQSAEAAYRRVLKLDRSNAQALAGLENMAKEYERSARQHLQAGAPQSSLEQIGKGLALAAGRVELLKLRQEAEQRIAELRAKKVEQERQQETQLQAEQSLFQAQSSFQEGLLEISLIHIEQGLVAVPQHQGLLALREQVKARVMEQQHQAEAQQRQQAEARRQAEEAERKKVEQARRQQEAGQSLIQAVELQKNGRYADSLQQIEKGLALIPDHPELTQLRDQIRAQQAAEKKQQAEQTKRDEEVKKLLEQAETQFKAKRLTEPVGNNAEATYRQLLKLDANNVQAQAGLVRIAQDYLQQAQQKKAAGALQDSLKLIEKGLSVIPNQAELMRLQEDVHAQLAVEQQKLEQQRQADKQRQEEKQRQKQRLKQQQEEKQRQEKQKKIEQQSNDKRQQDQQHQEQQRLEQQRLEEKQRQEQQRKEQQRQEEKQRQEQQKRVEQQRLEQQRKEQQRLDQQRLEQQRQEQQRKLEQQRQEPQRKEPQPEKQPAPETTTKPRVFGTF